MWPSRKDLLQLMGMDDTQWRDALYLEDLLSTLQQQRERDIDAKDIKGERTGYFYAARSMFRYTFRTAIGPFYDSKRKSLWYLGWKVSLQTCNYPLTNSDDLSQGPKECEDPQLDVRATYYILQKSRYLQVYSKAQPSKKIAKFDMVKPKERQAFVDVWRLIPDRYPPPRTSACLKRKDLLRVQGLHNGGHQRRNVKKLVAGRQSTLQERSPFSLVAPTQQVTPEAANGGGCVPD
jgi:hypothetical protein